MGTLTIYSNYSVLGSLANRGDRLNHSRTEGVPGEGACQTLSHPGNAGLARSSEPQDVHALSLVYDKISVAVVILISLF